MSFQKTYIITLVLVFFAIVNCSGATPFVIKELRFSESPAALDGLALASGDFDEDGVPDIIAAYAGFRGGVLLFHRGNVDSIYPNSPQAIERKMQGNFIDSPFLGPARFFDLPESPNFVGAGDFDADGHWDLVAASRGGRTLHLLTGDGTGDFAPARAIDIAGRITALVVGEINRRDGLNDIVIGVSGPHGAQALVFEGPEGALRYQPETFALPAEARALALSQLDDSYEMDLAVTAGSESLIIHGRDRKLSLDASRQAKVPPAKMERAFHLPKEQTAIPNVEGAVKASLPMRLNEDGSPDFVILTEGESTPIVALSQALATFTVNSTADPGDGVCDLAECTMREAINAANASPGADTIDFNLGAGTPTIAPTTPLPDITEQVTISGNTGGATRIVLHGPGLGGFLGDGLRVSGGSGNVLRNMQVIEFSGGGIHFIGATSGNFVEGCYVGTDGTAPLDNALFGVNLDDSGNNTVGGTVAAARNVISSNLFAGIASPSINSNGNFIRGNYVGTTDTGTSARANLGEGLDISSANNTIGGTIAGARNVISGNAENGIDFDHANTAGNLVQGNFIGTDVTGTVPLANVFDGVSIAEGSSNNTIGGTTPAARNVISNNGDGVSTDEGATGNLVQGNYIGTDVNGTADIGNFNGVWVQTSDNTIGGALAAAGNLIMGNDVDGVRIWNLFPEPVNPTGNLIRFNSIFSNGNLGIDLNNDDISRNDPCDPDAGANFTANFPVLTSVNIGGGNTTISGFLNSRPDTTFTLDFYSSPLPDRQGKTHLGSTQVTTDSTCNANIDVTFLTLLGPAGTDQFITATSTNPTNNTSEFSAVVAPAGVCTFEDLFNDNVVDWTIEKPNVTESGGFLALTPATRKSVATSPPAFTLCSHCTITAEISLPGTADHKAWMLTHRIDRKNQIEILFKEAADKVIVKLKVNGAILFKQKGIFTLIPNTVYSVSLTYDGTNITLSIGGTQVVSFAPGVNIPEGMVGFQSKGGTLSVDRVCVRN